jgi:hypothetical protein
MLKNLIFLIYLLSVIFIPVEIVNDQNETMMGFILIEIPDDEDDCFCDQNMQLEVRNAVTTGQSIYFQS